jgi:hypothetical protein
MIPAIRFETRGMGEDLVVIDVGAEVRVKPAAARLRSRQPIGRSRSERSVICFR